MVAIVERLDEEEDKDEGGDNIAWAHGGRKLKPGLDLWIVSASAAGSGVTAILTATLAMCAVNKATHGRSVALFASAFLAAAAVNTGAIVCQCYAVTKTLGEFA